MKLKGNPNELVFTHTRQAGKIRQIPLFSFDENGIADMDENKLSEAHINKLKELYEVIGKVIKEEVKEPKKVQKKSIRVCKQCGEEFDNQGQLLAHYREKHPKK